MVDRIVADNHALNHSAGPPLPQQVIMTMVSLSALMDDKEICQKDLPALRPLAAGNDCR